MILYYLMNVLFNDYYSILFLFVLFQFLINLYNEYIQPFKINLLIIYRDFIFFNSKDHFLITMNLFNLINFMTLFQVIIQYLLTIKLLINLIVYVIIVI